MHNRIYANIHMDALEQNLSSMKANLKEGTQMIGVIKADAYGHGAVPVAQYMEPKDYVWGFAAATEEEAVELRRAGITKPILILGFTFPEHYEQMAKLGIRPAVFTLEMAEQMAEAAQRVGETMHIHLAVDTGMGRIGLYDDARGVKTACAIAKLKGLQIEGLFTHFARADESSIEPAKIQLNRYLHFAGELEKAGLAISLHHVSNSACIMQFSEANLDLVRAGITLYGLFPSDEVREDPVFLHPLMELKSRVSYIKDVAPGTSISYGGTFVADHPMRVATIPVGYADGYPRSLSNKGYVLIHGRRCPILGRICMDQFMVDVTDLPQVHVFDDVTLLGTDGDEQITAEMLGDLSGRFNYELVCNISKRVPRIYVK